MLKLHSPLVGSVIEIKFVACRNVLMPSREVVVYFVSEAHVDVHPPRGFLARMRRAGGVTVSKLVRSSLRQSH